MNIIKTLLRVAAALIGFLIEVLIGSQEACAKESMERHRQKEEGKTYMKMECPESVAYWTAIMDNDKLHH